MSAGPVGKRKRTGMYCVAWGCNSTHRDNLSLHTFPKESDRPSIRRQWVKFVQVRRKDFTKPTINSVLCEKHFISTCYPPEYEIKKAMGMEIARKILLPTAVPTIHMPVDTSETVTPVSGTNHKKAMRSAYRKREFKRVLFEAETDTVPQEKNDDILPHEQVNEPLDHMYGNKEIACEAQNKEVGTQYSGSKPHKKSHKTQTRPSVTNKGIQVISKPKTRSVAIQCNLLGSSTSTQDKLDTVDAEESDDETENLELPIDNLKDDPTFNPDSESIYSSDDDSSVDDNSVDDNSPEVTVLQTRKYIVYENNLMELFRTCPKCAAPTLSHINGTMGTMVKITQECGICDCRRTWTSQPMVGSIPAGNLAMSSAILFSGSLPSKSLRFLDHMNMATISTDTFLNHQKHYLHPAVSREWKRFQTIYFSQMRTEGDALVLGGDGRADSPGHSAKFGSYSMLDLRIMLVVDIQLIQSNEVKGSSHMEKAGLIRSIQTFKNEDLQIGTLVTDRHVQIVKWVRENMPQTTHNFDVWHVAKGIKKKLTAISKERDCGDLAPWIQSISNHVYWTAASTPDGDGSEMLQKWQSLANHVINKHKHEGSLFPVCQHGPRIECERRKKWLKRDSKVAAKVQDLVLSKQMVRDIPKLSPGPQTSALEGYHAIINHYAPKMIGFSYHGMRSRIIIAAMHYNENGMRNQAETKDGNKRYSIVFPKYKPGKHTTRKVKVSCTYGYVRRLMAHVFSLANSQTMLRNPLCVKPGDAPPPLASMYHRPDKSMAIEEYHTRFNQPERESLCTPVLEDTDMRV